MRTIAFGFAFLWLVVPAHAQNTGDARWSRWTGCWELVTENSREGVPGPTTARREPRTPARDTDQPQVCVETSPNGGATFSTKVGTQTPIVQTVVPDGTDRPVTEDGCTGTQRAEWSADGLRLYARAELNCKADQGIRRVSGLALIGPDGRWTDVQSVDVSGRESFRVRKYRRAAGSVAAMPTVSGTALTLEDVKEASAKVSPRALEAALVETRASFDLTSKSLLDLSAAGVSASVVDLIVALSYPDRFIIERTASVDRGYSPIIDDPFPVGWAFGSPFWFDLYGPYSPYYYSPFAYPYYPYYPYYGGGGGYIIDGGGGGGGGGGNVPQQPSGRGRVVDGQGYTRVRPRDAEPATPGSTASSSGGGGGSSTSSSSGGSSSGGGVSSQGFSSGGSSGGDGGRTAQPR
jgi:hypothetical protein